MIEVTALERKLSILLIEDEPLECKAIIEYADTVDDVFLIGITNNAVKALDYVRDYKPDVIILDLELHKGSGNGLSFLNSLQQLELSIFPYILITTNNTSSVTYEQARKLGADFIMSKNQEDYSAQNVIDFLRSMKKILHGKNSLLESSPVTEPSSNQLHKRILKRIITEIELIGISPKATGRKYLIDAIELTMNGKTQKIYTIIGQKYSKTDSSVERAMQNAINAAWRSTDIEDLQLHYTARINSQKGVPTITEFIHYYSDKIKNDYL